MAPGEGKAEAHPVLLDERLQTLPGPASLIQHHLTCAGERRRVYNQIHLLPGASNIHISIQCCGSGSESTCTRIHLAVLDPDPYWECGYGSGTCKLTEILEKNLVFCLSKMLFYLFR